MIAIQTFPTAESAHLAAAYLGNAGIEASVIDERGLGGNLLGSTTPGIRIEVEEDQQAEAEKLLAEYDASTGQS